MVFDIDRPEVLEFNDQVPAAYGVKPRADRRTMPMDLRSDRPAAQAAAGADATVAMAWSADGLLPYLPGAVQDALFTHIGELPVGRGGEHPCRGRAGRWWRSIEPVRGSG